MVACRFDTSIGEKFLFVTIIGAIVCKFCPVKNDQLSGMLLVGLTSALKTSFPDSLLFLQTPESKKQEFRKYLEKSGVIDALTKGI